MRLARRALFAALAMLMLCAAVSAQTLRDENDPRNQSPSVGTGGPEGGPTGLFTIYDGATIRKGEFTFSLAYSNFDRDPGNVDITDIPLSFNVGLNDHIELFFKTNAYRGIKVNNPLNLSSFYLPNSQLNCGPLSATGTAPRGASGLCSGAAIVQFSTGPFVGNLGRLATFRPLNNQPFVQFPFIGGSAGTFNQGPGFKGSPFGFPGFSASLSTPIVSAGSGSFSAADNFPGIGSPVGSILPGIVLSTVNLPCTILTGACPPLGGSTPANPITVPVTFTIAPSYLPDAPFVNRLYGESSFTNHVAGAKFRLTGPNNPLGVGAVAFYRWYPDKADSFRGFNQMQRGAGPGGDLGDFGLIGFVDGRLSRSVNISANIGYILNSNPKSNLGTGTEFVLLDRPDELLTGVGFDFPITKHFQPIAEFRSTTYVAGRTPNAFENSPMEGLVGFKAYPRRWWGFGFAYRRHLNQQDKSRFDGNNFNTQINNLSGIVVRGTTIIVPGTTRPATVGGFPNGFIPSDDPNGFLGQLWIGRRNVRAPSILPNQPPTVTLSSSTSTITLGCPPGTSNPNCQASASQTVQLTANATDPDGDTLLYTYTTTGGRITGEGPNVTWDLTGVTPGTYTASVEVDDGCGCISFSSTQVTVTACTGCVPPCPTVNVSCPDTVDAGSPVTFTANVSGGDPNVTPTFNWSVSAGTISSGQGTSSITVDTTGLSGQTITATVDIGGLEPSCTRTASCTASVRPLPVSPRKFDTYGNIRFNDEKARLDNFAIELQNTPGEQGYIIAYGSCTGEAQARADRAKDYLVNTRGIDASRIVTVDGGCRSELSVDLWVVPAGATPPTADTSGAVDPCPDCKVTKKKPSRRYARRRGRRGDDE